MIEVRLFAGLRDGRQKVYQMEPGDIQMGNNRTGIGEILRLQHDDLAPAFTQGSKQTHFNHNQYSDLKKWEGFGKPLPLLL